MKEYYLDANAHVSPSKETLNRFCELSNMHLGHPSGINASSRKATNILESSREKIAELIGAKSPSQIFFTHNCTQACEWAINILNNLLGSNLVRTSNMEHNAVKDPSKNINLFNPINDSINQSDYLIVIHLQNEIGIINDIKDLRSKSSFLFSDMSQSLGKIPVNVTELNVDIATFGGHKFGGLDIGFMYLKDPSLWISFGTGSRYFQDRAGTPSVALVGATTFALEQAIKSLPYRVLKNESFQRVFEKGVEQLGYNVVGKEFNRSFNTSFLHKKNSIDTLLNLSNKNIYVGLGSACGSMATGISPTLIHLGFDAKKNKHTDFMRVSQWGEYDDKDANQILKVMEEFND